MLLRNTFGPWIVSRVDCLIFNSKVDTPSLLEHASPTEMWCRRSCFHWQWVIDLYGCWPNEMTSRHQAGTFTLYESLNEKANHQSCSLSLPQWSYQHSWSFSSTTQFKIVPRVYSSWGREKYFLVESKKAIKSRWNKKISKTRFSGNFFVFDVAALRSLIQSECWIDDRPLVSQSECCIIDRLLVVSKQQLLQTLLGQQRSWEVAS